MSTYRPRHPDKFEDRDPNLMWMDHGDGYVIPLCNGKYQAVGDRIEVIRDADILFHTNLLLYGKRTPSGQLVASETVAWNNLRIEILSNPALLEEFPTWSRKFEEFIAGIHRKSNWSEVILTPRSRDNGYDIEAFNNDQRIFDEAKAYKTSLKVKHQAVRAALGLFTIFPNINQVRVTTTSTFATHIESDFAHLIPEKLKLRNRQSLIRWIQTIDPQG